MTRHVTDAVDGVNISAHAATISGTFQLDPLDAQHLAYDDEVMFVIVGRVKAPRFREASNGDLTRIAVIKPREAAVVLKAADRRALAEAYQFEFMDLGSVDERDDFESHLVDPVETHVEELSVAEPAGAARTFEESTNVAEEVFEEPQGEPLERPAQRTFTPMDRAPGPGVRSSRRDEELNRFLYGD